MQLVCKVVPGQHRALHNAVPPQHSTFDLFEQAGAALHPALCELLCTIVQIYVEANVAGLVVETGFFLVFSLVLALTLLLSEILGWLMK